MQSTFVNRFRWTHQHAPPRPSHLPQGDINVPRVVQGTVQQLPTLARQLALGWSDRVLAS